MLYASYHTKDDRVKIECKSQKDKYCVESYPVLKVGDVTMFPTDDQLLEIIEAINAYFVAKNARED